MQSWRNSLQAWWMSESSLACLCVCVLNHWVTSNSLQPHGLKDGRLFRPWDFPGKHTGMDYHFLLQGNFPDPGIEPMTPTLAGRFFTTASLGKPLIFQSDTLWFISSNRTRIRIINSTSRSHSDLSFPPCKLSPKTEIL